MELYSHNKTLVLFIFLLATFALGRGTRVGFYTTTCPRAEAIVQSVVHSSIQANPDIAPGLLRMFFHDCFVNGCDASILLDGSSSEKTSPFNSRLRGFDVIDAAKSQLETACPGVVSCADILALAARDSVVETGGSGWAVRTGRRDGLVSQASDTGNLPGFKDSIKVQIRKFADKGLNTQDLVTLSGGHTIGTAACGLFSYRLYNFNHTNRPDPAIQEAFLRHLRSLCPISGDNDMRVGLDTGSVYSFDVSYYENLRSGRAVLESDLALWGDPRTQKYVQWFLGVRKQSESTFNVEFGRSMVKMGNVGVKIGKQGEIRRVCHAIN